MTEPKITERCSDCQHYVLDTEEYPCYVCTHQNVNYPDSKFEPIFKGLEHAYDGQMVEAHEILAEEVVEKPSALSVQEGDAQADRHNNGKAKLSYLLSTKNAIDGVAGVMEYGAKKYARDNWKNGLLYTEVADSLLRHLSAFINGEDVDAESGLPHVDHVSVNALFLAEFFRTKHAFDDRSK